LFWITKGGADPLAYFARFPDRFPLVHVKDMNAGGDMVDVGTGVIDWRRVFARRAQAGIRHFFVEHDEPADPFASIRASYQYLRRLEL
jgi:sugar phosphate isomerase/epimerase